MRRKLLFSDWHRTLSRNLMAFDVDLVEWRIINGQLTPVAVLEVTVVEPEIRVGSRYLEAILVRYRREHQGRVASLVASALGVKAFIVLHRSDLSRFWLYNLTDSKGWKALTPDGMIYFLEQVGQHG